MPDDQYTSNLAEFVDKKIKAWAENKKKLLEPKLRKNFEAVTNQDHRTKAWKKDEAKGWRSDTWVGYVRVKIWSFYSVMMDTVLRAGKLPFTLDPSPNDENYMTPEMLQDRDARLEKMTDKIESQLAARNADRTTMREWLSGGYYGMAFSAFNIEDVESVEYKMVLPNGMDVAEATKFVPYEEIVQYARHEMATASEPVPGHRYVSVWNMVWDMDADGLQPKDGSEGYAERIKSCPYDLRSLEGPGYIEDAIERVIKESRNRENQTSDVAETPGKEALRERKKTIERYAFYMRVPEKIAMQFEQDLRRGGDDVFSLNPIEDTEEAEESGYDVEVIGEIADQHIIRYIRNDTGKRPHKLWTVEQNLDETTGTGIADNMESVQGALVGMIRAFEDNKKLSANVTAALKARYFNDPGQTKDIWPGKTYDIADDCDDVRKAIMPIVFPDVGESLMSGISLMMQLKDDVSMIPTIMQGFVLPKQKSDTAYEMRQLTENAGKYIGQAIRNYDEQQLEPKIQDIYDYNMIYGDDEACKVNCKVKANGFTSFQNKEMRGMRMRDLLAMVLSSELLLPNVKIRPHLEPIYESMDEDPQKFLKSEEEMMQDAEQDAQAKVKAFQEAMAALKAEEGIKTQSEIVKKGVDHKAAMQEKALEHIFETDKMDQELDGRVAEMLIDTLFGRQAA